MKQLPPYLYLIFATLFWGGNFVFGRAIITDLPPASLAFLRWCIAFLLFYIIKGFRLKHHWVIIRNHLFIIFLMSLTGIAGYSVLIYLALHYTTSINASLMNTLAPIMIYILSIIFLKEKVTLYLILGLALSLIGVLFIINNGSLLWDFNFSVNIGDLLVLLAVLLWAIYSIITNQFSNRLPSQSTFLISILLGIIILFPFFIYELFLTPFEITWSLISISAILYTGIFASVLAYLFWNFGIKNLGAAYAGVYMNLIPVFASLFATVFIGESLNFYHIIGGILVVSGIQVTKYKRKISRN